MILADNLPILKTQFPNILSQLEMFDSEKNISSVEETKTKQKTIAILKEGKKKYLHSKYNPSREAEAVVSSLEDITDETSILFYGTGMGYHIDLILKKHPNLSYYIYEPVPEILHSFLSNVSLKRLQTNRFMGISTNIEETKLNTFIDRNRESLKIVILPSHEQVFKEEYQKFKKDFLDMIKSKKNSMYTNYSFQKRWVINSLKNFNETLRTPNIILEKKNSFQGKTAILVSAGPSLNAEIENLREIKEKGSAYIFSVGSSINTLIHNGIFPDAACTYDPTILNQKVFATIKEKGIQNIPLIYGSSVGYETLEDYPGDTYHMITSQDTVANFFLKNESAEPIHIVYDAPSIAAVTLQLLSILGFSNIILVGQNLGYLGKKSYSEGIPYAKELTELEINSGILVKDVYGTDILTNETFNSMREQIENLIGNMTKQRVINTTKGGAHIEGTEFIELRTVSETLLTEAVVDINWLSDDKTIYDQEFLHSRIKSMNKSYKNSLKINQEYIAIVEKIDKAIHNRNYTQAENLYIKLNKALRKIERNDFHQTFILPMNRVQYRILTDSIERLNSEKNPKIKGEKITKSFRKFIEICTTDIEILTPIYEKMIEQIICE